MKKLFAVLFLALFSLSAFAAVDINTATVQELQSIKGIGEQTAKAIVEYRDANGAFASIDDLANVKGIKAKKLESLKSELTVADSSTAEKAAEEVKKEATTAATEVKEDAKAAAKETKAAAKKAKGKVKEGAQEVKEEVTDAAKAVKSEAKDVAATHESKASHKAMK
ncbi:MAG: helix-hairpin-helix domain-containing protein [Burkholderiales bacterium]|nr:helix-hairpin-helix domain-containing protein [Burkholderiales bacterium]